MLILHLLVDCRDAMGANAVNTMAETIASKVESITGGTVILRIISNLAVHRLARVSAIFTKEKCLMMVKILKEVKKLLMVLSKPIILRVADPFRATTHNKGIMNAISPIAIACGQDWRAIESGAHSYASYKQEYGSMTHWEKTEDGDLFGSIEIPMAVG